MPSNENTSGFSRRHYLNAIVAEIGNIRAFVRDLDLEAYSNDLKTQYATERALLNVSEAVRNLERQGRRTDPDFSLPSLSPDIEWQKIKGIGNVLRHDYETVVSSRVWAVVTEHLDRLERACQSALDLEGSA